MLAMRVCVSSAQFSFWRSNELQVLVAWSRGFHFWRESKTNSRCYWRCVLSRWVLPQQREVQILWWLCNNSEIHYWLWQLRSLVVCSQSSFHVTRARKDDKNRQKTLFLCWKRCYTRNNCSLMFHFNQPKMARKNFAWITKYEKLSEICIVQHVEKKSVFTFQPKKTTSFYDCWKCKGCCHVLNIPFRDQKLTIMLFGDDGTHWFARKTSRDYEKEKPSPFLKNVLRQSQPSTSEPVPKKVKMSPIME